METLNKKTLSFSAKLFSQAVTALAMVTALAACGNNGSNNGPVGPQLGVPGNVNIANCASCAGSMINPQAVDVFNAKNFTGIASLQNMQLVVSGASFVPGSSASYNLYRGPVAVQGTFTVNRTVSDPVSGFCVIPAGSYTVQSTEVGSLLMGRLMLPTLVSTTANIVLEIRHGVLYKDAMTQRTRLYGNLYIKSVNGQMCSQYFSDLLN